MEKSELRFSVTAHRLEQLGKFAYFEKVGSIVAIFLSILDLTLCTRAGQLEEDFLNMHTRLVSNEVGLSSDRSVEIGLVKEMAVCD